MGCNPFMLACSSCRREAREQATLEKAERAIFLAALGHHLDALRARMGEDEWAAFAEQLYQRLRPAVTQDDLSIDVTVLRQLSDDIRELCLGWPGVVRDTFEWLAARAAEGAAGMAFPKRWREKQDLLSRFQHLERKLGKTRGEEGDLNGESKSGESSKGFVEVGLFFCTLREPSGRRTPADFFGSERARAPSTGILRVSLLDFDAVASNNRRLPFDWTYSRTRVTGNTSKRPEISACVVLDVQPLLCNTPRGREATVFVPGFNCSFAWAAKKLALYAYKLRGDTPVFLFSWPSFESVDQYGGDEAHAMWAAPYFATFLKQLLTSCRLEKVHVLAHSMGARVALNALARMTEWKAPKGPVGRLGQLVLAAPDFDTGEFFNMQAELSGIVERISVYSSSNDQALHVSARVHGGLSRLGYFSAAVMLSESRHVALADNVDVIDATGFDKSVVGHLYPLTHAGIIEDVCAALRGAAASSRGRALRLEQFENTFRHWRFVGSAEQQATEEEENVEAQLDEHGMGEEDTS